MAEPSDLVGDLAAPLEPARSSQATVVSSALSDTVPRSGAERQLLGTSFPRARASRARASRAPAPHPGAGPGLHGRAVMSGLTAIRSPGHVGTARASLGLTKWTMGSSVVVSVTGEVDIATADQLSEALGAALRRRPKGLICDLSGVGFLGAAGLTALLVARQRAIACHTWFDLASPQPLPRRVIALVGLSAVFSLHDDVAEAATAQARRERRPGLPGAMGAR